MPNPTARPVEKAAPANLDALVREAMQAGNTQKLRRALESAKADGDGSAGTRAGAGVTGLAGVTGTPSVAQIGGGWLGEGSRWGALKAAVSAAERAEGDALRAALLEIEEALAAAWAEVPEPEPLLPAIRHPWMLVGPAGGMAWELAEELGVDVATARVLAAGRWPRVVLRGADAGFGGKAAEPYRALGRSELLAVPEALSVLRVVSLRPLVVEVSEECIWTTEPMSGGQTVELVPELVLSGHVEVREQRQGGSESRWLRKRLQTRGAKPDRRVDVLDVHTGMGIFRLVQGVTKTHDLAEHDPYSGARTFSTLYERLSEGLPTVEPRVCWVGADGRSAWPAWEEHTRVVSWYLRGSA